MRIFAVSDVHVDFEENARWVEGLSNLEFGDDALILAGDVSNIPGRFLWCLEQFKSKFSQVFFVPGNHELWINSDERMDSLEKFFSLIEQANALGVITRRTEFDSVIIVPLFSWYDYSFGRPGEFLLQAWMDFRMCRWPENLSSDEVICDYFLSLNDVQTGRSDKTMLSFSHFLPRIDLMPTVIPQDKRRIYPVLGSVKLDSQIRALHSDIHVYGHSHVNRNVELDGVRYINNAFAYPNEQRIARKRLVEVLVGADCK